MGIRKHWLLNIDKLSPVTLDPFVHAIWGLQFYMLGILMERVEKANGFLYELGILSVILVGVYMLSASLFAASQIFYLYCVYFACRYFPGIYKWFVIVGKETMGIYLLHAPIVIYGFSFILNRYILDEGVLFVAIWVATFSMSFYLSRILSRFRIGRFVFGSGEFRR